MPSRAATRCVPCVLMFAMGLCACGGEPAAAPSEAAGPEVPALGVLELPVSLRTSGAAPSGGSKLELTPAGIRLDDKALLALEGGKVPAAERDARGITKLRDALQAAKGKPLSLALHSSLPYETAALSLQTAAEAGITQLSFHVRKGGGAGTETGWLELRSFAAAPRSEGEVAIAGVDPRTWDEFAGVWQAAYDGCRTAQTGSCAYVPESVPKGGALKIVLQAAGQGVNVNFHRVGVSAEQLAAEEQARQAELAKQREDAVQGRAEPSALEQELVDGPPTSEALFQFRAREALSAPSPVSATLAPLCGSRACGAVVSAEPTTPMVRVISLIGAAFPDGSAAPTLHFELP